MDRLGLPECIYFLVFEARERFGWKSDEEVKGEGFGSFFKKFKDLIGFIERLMNRAASHLVNRKVFLGSF